MRILIIGGGGMIGQKLATSLQAHPLQGPDDRITLFDRAFPGATPAGVERIVGDVTNSAAISDMISRRFDVIYHLASIVSGEAEADYQAGYTVNLIGFWAFLSGIEAEACASEGVYRPRVIFTSSIAVFGPPYPDAIPDDFPVAPRTSYGTQKATCELLIADATRRGLIDGVSLRLPTITVRPGAPNKAASSFYSGIIREPLAGVNARLPVPRTLRHWFASPRSAARFLRHAGLVDLAPIGPGRTLNMPGVSATVQDMLDALRTVVGEDALAHVTDDPDETVHGIVANWPERFDAQRAIDLGFEAEETFEDIIRVYLEDDAPKARS